ncbi:MAG: hypothetical protein ACRDHP_01200 [Ktedonobacterales bacterium]
MYPNTPGRRPSIREILAGQNIQGAGGGMSEHEIANLLAPFTALSGDMFYASMKAGQALGNRLGIKTGKQLSRGFPVPYPTTVLALVLALRRLDKEITAIFDTPRGSSVEAKLPTDLFSMGGTMSFEIIDAGPPQTIIQGSAEIKGQIFDWGKTARALNEVFDTATDYARRMTGG